MEHSEKEIHIKHNIVLWHDAHLFPPPTKKDRASVSQSHALTARCCHCRWRMTRSKRTCFYCCCCCFLVVDLVVIVVFLQQAVGHHRPRQLCTTAAVPLLSQPQVQNRSVRSERKVKPQKDLKQHHVVDSFSLECEHWPIQMPKEAYMPIYRPKLSLRNDHSLRQEKDSQRFAES